MAIILLSSYLCIRYYPVSYTHLYTSAFTYYTPVLCGYHMVDFNEIKKKLMGHLNKQILGPVSYTHLDVYKRQVLYYSAHRRIGHCGTVNNCPTVPTLADYSFQC